MKTREVSQDYTPDPVPIKSTIMWLLILLLFVLGSMVVARLLYHPELVHIFGRCVEGDFGTFCSQQAPLNNRPRLQIDEVADLAAYRAKQNTILTQYSRIKGSE